MGIKFKKRHVYEGKNPNELSYEEALALMKPFKKKEPINYTIEKCAVCGKEFKKKKKWAQFCSGACRWANWNREHPRLGLVGNEKVKEVCGETNLDILVKLKAMDEEK